MLKNVGSDNSGNFLAMDIVSNGQSEASFFSKMFTASEKVDQSLDKTIKQNGLRKGSFVGTRDYLAPEMVGDMSISGPFSDLWALGIIAFQLYTGNSPWQSGQ